MWEFKIYINNETDASYDVTAPTSEWGATNTILTWTKPYNSRADFIKYLAPGKAFNFAKGKFNGQDYIIKIKKGTANSVDVDKANPNIITINQSTVPQSAEECKTLIQSLRASLDSNGSLTWSIDGVGLQLDGSSSFDYSNSQLPGASGTDKPLNIATITENLTSGQSFDVAKIKVDAKHEYTIRIKNGADSAPSFVNSILELTKTDNTSDIKTMINSVYIKKNTDGSISFSATGGSDTKALSADSLNFASLLKPSYIKGVAFTTSAVVNNLDKLEIFTEKGIEAAIKLAASVPQAKIQKMAEAANDFVSLEAVGQSTLATLEI